MNPIKERPTWNIIDSTKLQCFATCPRKYFYNYLLGWDFEEPNIHLEFGQAWHLAMESLLQHGYGADSQELAYALLLQHYRKFWSEMVDDQNFPKSPPFAKKMMADYCKKFSDDFQRHEVLYTETSGTVPIADDRVLYFKTDSILRGIKGNYGNKAFSREHKTAGKRGSKWSLKIQIGTYNHVLYCLFGPSDTYGVEVNEAFFQKTRPDFERTQILKNPVQMNIWLWHVNYLMDMLEWETERMLSCNIEDPFMTAFPMNNESCNVYGSCVYYDYCTSWSNPLQRIEQIPMGMKEKHWNPSELETTNKMDLT